MSFIYTSLSSLFFTIYIAYFSIIIANSLPLGYIILIYFVYFTILVFFLLKTLNRTLSARATKSRRSITLATSNEMRGRESCHAKRENK